MMLVENATVNSNIVPHGPRPTSTARKPTAARRHANAATVRTVAGTDNGVGDYASPRSPLGRASRSGDGRVIGEGQFWKLVEAAKRSGKSRQAVKTKAQRVR